MRCRSDQGNNQRHQTAAFDPTLRILLFDLGEAILPPRPQFNCAVVSSGGQGWPPLGGHPKGSSLTAASTAAGLAARGQKTIITAAISTSRAFLQHQEVQAGSPSKPCSQPSESVILLAQHDGKKLRIHTGTNTLSGSAVRNTGIMWLSDANVSACVSSKRGSGKHQNSGTRNASESGKHGGGRHRNSASGKSSEKMRASVRRCGHSSG